MPKPLKETFWSRVYRLFYGMVFYNTIYWRRASDGLQPPRLTRDERLLNRPPLDVRKIKPRANPRAKLETQEYGTPDVSVPLIQGAASKLSPGTPPAPVAFTEGEKVEATSGELVRTRKKKRRRIRQSSPKGFFERLFGAE